MLDDSREGLGALCALPGGQGSGEFDGRHHEENLAAGQWRQRGLADCMGRSRW
ncbi:hypothetical protein HOP52_18765 [Halomonas campisalis]|uniref:Uncharacterized protein n=1 Tax=Billgrantia campisalis TaxID=74661 RepID=A0ABS9PDG3_9GAMM|nr:hypothetical protein [Halomonas campisalis]MCG6659793.1 hypothetical protein [Halomonas campisalis]MDR5864947.1 hypothetical protein [Halomonas campisalis]